MRRRRRSWIDAETYRYIHFSPFSQTNLKLMTTALHLSYSLDSIQPDSTRRRRHLGQSSQDVRVYFHSVSTLSLILSLALAWYGLF